MNIVKMKNEKSKIKKLKMGRIQDFLSLPDLRTKSM